MRKLIGIVAAIAALWTATPIAANDTPFMIDRQFADHFAQDWIDSWNKHDLKRILAHYADDIELASPFIVVRGASPTGYLRGKDALTQYWGPVLGPTSTLKFELTNVLVAVDSIAILYKTTGGGGRLAVEVFHFNEQGAVSRSYAHYTEPLPK